MLPRHSTPSTLPATRMTNRSFGDWSKICSIGARASEQPSTSANGVCTGGAPATSGSPSDIGSDGITTWSRGMVAQ